MQKDVLKDLMTKEINGNFLDSNLFLIVKFDSTEVNFKVNKF